MWRGETGRSESERENTTDPLTHKSGPHYLTIGPHNGFWTRCDGGRGRSLGVGWESATVKGKSVRRGRLRGRELMCLVDGKGKD